MSEIPPVVMQPQPAIVAPVTPPLRLRRFGPRKATRSNRESGYALLLVFLMAAVVALSLYSEIPRVAFQAQRHKEQLLMERGLQYMRAIQVYNQVNKGQWPRNLDDIETLQTRHFLRHRYVDPMTGKAEWRLIHIQAGALIDSLVTRNPAGDKESASTGSSYISAYAGVGQVAVGDQIQRPQDRRRASEGGGGGAGDLPMLPGAGLEQPGPPAERERFTWASTLGISRRFPDSERRTESVDHIQSEGF